MKIKLLCMALCCYASLSLSCSFASLPVTQTDEKAPLPQVYKYHELMQVEREKVAGGKGILHCHFAFRRDAATPESAVKEMAWLVLHPGDSVGHHAHAINEDTYIIVSGSGIFTDTSGKKIPVTTGDMTICRPGEKHGIENTGDVPLVMVNVMAQNDTYKQNHPDAVPPKK